MSSDALLSRLEGVRRTGEGRWRARCPVHGSKSGTLAIREETDGRILLHCHALCPPADILTKLGLDWQDLFPERLTDERIAPVRKPWRVGDVVRALKFELTVGMVILGDLQGGRPISDHDRARAGVCADRVATFLRELEHAA